MKYEDCVQMHFQSVICIYIGILNSVFHFD